jgi:hypothetical protein
MTVRCLRSRGRSVNVVTRLRAGLLGFVSRQTQDISLLATEFGTHSATYPLGTACSFPGDKTDGS